MLFPMTPLVKEPKDRRQDTERRLRFAIRKANDRMFSILRSPGDRDKGGPVPRARHS